MINQHYEKFKKVAKIVLAILSLPFLIPFYLIVGLIFGIVLGVEGTIECFDAIKN